MGNKVGIRFLFTTLRLIFKNKDYSTLFIVNIISATLLGMFVPVFPLWIINELATSVSLVFLLISITGIMSSVLNVFIGHITDRIGKRKQVVELGFILLALRALMFSLFTNIWVIIAVNWVVHIANGSLIFAILDDKIKKNGHENKKGLITSSIRISFSLGFVIGPLLGIGIITFFSYSSFFFLSSMIYIILFLITRGLIADSEVLTPSTSAEESNSRASKKYMLIIPAVLIMICFFIGNIVNGALLTLYVNELFVTWAIALILGIGPIFEIMIFPLVGVINDKYGTKITLILGSIWGFLYFLFLSLTDHLILLVIIQIFGAFYVGVIFVSLMIYIQDIFKERAGFSSSLYFSAMSIASILGNALVGSLLFKWSYNFSFFILGICTLMASVIILILHSAKATMKKEKDFDLST